MRTGFTVIELVNFYIEKLAGTAYSRRRREELPVYIVYQDVMELLEGENQASSEGRALAKKYKEKIIGKTALTWAPQEYHDSGVMEAHDIRLHEWSEYTIDQRARILAYHYLKNMIAVVDAHYHETDEANKRTEEEGKKKAKEKGGKRSRNDSGE